MLDKAKGQPSGHETLAGARRHRHFSSAPVGRRRRAGGVHKIRKETHDFVSPTDKPSMKRRHIPRHSIASNFNPRLYRFLAAGLLGLLPLALAAGDDRQSSSPASIETPQNQADTPPSTISAEQMGARALSKAFRDASKRATPAVVTIVTYGVPQPVPDNLPEGQAPPAQPDDQTRTGVGSGVIIDAKGRILTNNHVIAGAQRVEVQLVDSTVHEATGVIGDPSSDVAVLEIDHDTSDRIAQWGDSDDIQIGDWVLAIGSPFELEATVSAGIISAKNRELTGVDRVRLFQTDAAVNPGNSGGPLIDLDGRVVGINTAIATRTGRYQGIGFVIPINQARWIAGELSEHGEVRRAAIGVTMAELNPRIAAMFKLPPRSGVLAYEIVADSSADVAGVKKLDVIVSFAGVRYTDPAKLRAAIERLPIGSKHPMQVQRQGETIDLEITLASVEDPTLPNAPEK
ncbi:MAG: trypsin-like peptidase domain-containing protein [Planctomycetota bacterium]